MVPKSLQRFDLFFDYVSHHVSASHINPKNEAKRRARFFRDGKDPRFSYSQPNPATEALAGVLHELSIDTSTPLGKLYDEKRKDLLLKMRLAKSVGTDEFCKVSERLYPPPNEALVKQAYSLLDLKSTPPKERILRKDGIKLVRAVLDRLGLHYKVRSVDMVTSARVAPSQGLLQLRKRERFFKDYFQRLIVHEIGTHLLRYENGRRLQLCLFRNGFPGYLETEEGLAVYNEYYFGLMTNGILRNYAGRVVAISYARQHGFAQTYQHLRKHFSRKASWKLALRAKRGLRDTSIPGAYTKDASYLRGFVKVLRYAERHGTDALYTGKIGLQDLDQEYLREYVKEPLYTAKQLFDEGLIVPSDRRVDLEEVRRLLL